MDALDWSDVFLFDRFRLHRSGGALFSRDATGIWQQVEIGSRALDVLGALVERHGELVPRDEIMRAVWPGQVIEDHNLSVQISAVRRVIDAGRTKSSCIQTVPGRGYRFIASVTRLKAGGAGAAIAAPRLSIVVLPFDNLSGEPKDEHLADAITYDLTSDLSFIPDVSVTAIASADTYRRPPKDVQTIAQELKVRYVLKGSVRLLDSILRVSVQLVSGETGAQLWSDRFDQGIGEQATGQEEVVRRIRDEIGVVLIDIESARSGRERPTNPDAFDLVLRVRSLRNQLPTLKREREILSLLERVLELDPTSVYAMTYIAYYLANHDGWTSFEKMQRAERLLAQARAIAPDSPIVLNAYVLWLRAVGRCAEAIEACQQAIQLHPNRIRGYMGIYHELGRCKTWTGHVEEGIAIEQEANRLNPRSPWRYLRYRHIGWYSLLLGRDLDAIEYLERSVAINAEDDGYIHLPYRRLAAAYARIGRMQEARQYIARAGRLRPYDTVRGCAPEILVSPVYVEQYRRFQDALRLAGLRDHADEDADFDVPSDAALHDEPAGPTPTKAPGVNTVRTAELIRFLAEVRPIIVDTMTYSWGRSISGAVGLKYCGLGGSFSDDAQAGLCKKMRQLTEGELDKPIVSVGWNSERFDGRNLALRLATLGYTHVYWYRGGREAWEVAGLPETGVDVQEW
jgi:TolB-like protein/tetratricopeptide (TPR) repeat protein